jgi:hypothetical protein
MTLMHVFQATGLFIAICVGVAVAMTAVLATLTALEPRTVPVLSHTARRGRLPG